MPLNIKYAWQSFHEHGYTTAKAQDPQPTNLPFQTARVKRRRTKLNTLCFREYPESVPVAAAW